MQVCAEAARFLLAMVDSRYYALLKQPAEHRRGARPGRPTTVPHASMEAFWREFDMFRVV